MAYTDEQVFVHVDGRQVDLAEASIVSVSLEQSLHLADAFSVTLANGLQWLQDDVFAIGKEVKIELAQGRQNRRSLLTGEVTGLMPSLEPDNQVHLVVRGYDKSHRLLRGNHTRAYVQMKDSDIATRIAQDMGFGTENVKTTTEVHPYVMQQNQSHLEFLQGRAAAIGYQVGVFENTLYFNPIGEPISPGTTNEVELHWGENLESFDIARTTPAQTTKVVVHGWDYKKKEAVVGESNSSDTGPQTRRAETGNQILRRAFGMEAPMTVVRPDVDSQAAAERLARVIADEMQSIFTTAEGSASGNPALRPGITVKIVGAGIFEGKYRITSTRHVFDRDGYRTEFKVEGARPPASIFPTAIHSAAPASFGRTAGQFPSFAQGLVSDNDDPDGLGRVKVKLPAFPDAPVTHWCRVLTPMAGQGRGFYTPLEVDDEVLVAFDGSSLLQAVVIGAFYNGVDPPPKATNDPGPPRRLERDKVVPDTKPVANGKVVHRIFKSRAGHMLLFDDTSGKEQVVVSDKNGNYIVLQSKGNTLKIRTSGNIEVETDSNISLKAGGNIDIDARGTLNLKGGRVNIN